MNTDELDLFGMLRRRRGYILLGTLLGLVAATMYFLLTKPTYRAEMQILVGQKSGDVVSGGKSDASVEGVAAEDDVLSTHIQLLTSRRILQAALENNQLDQLPSIRNAIDEGIPALSYIRDKLSVTKGGEGVAKDAHTLTATYDDPSPEHCATILRAIYDQYASYLQQHFEGTSSQAVQLLTKLSKDISDDVKEAEQALSDAMASTTLMWDGEASRNIHKERLAKLEEDLLVLTEEEVAATSRLEVIRDFIESKNQSEVTDFDRLALLSEKEVNRLKLMFEVTRGDIASEAFQAEQPIRQETARAEYSEYLALVMREKKLVEKFGDDHPSVISIREQIGLMRQFIDKNSAKIKGSETRERMEPIQMFTTYVSLLMNDIAGIREQRKLMLQRSEEELAKAKSLENDEMAIASLRMELRRRQDLYKSTQDTLQELNFVRDYAGFSTDVIGEAEAQQEPAWPILWIVLGLGLAAGGTLGLAMALTAELCDSTFSSPEDLQVALDTNVLGHIPRLPKLRKRRKDKPFAVDPTIYAFHRPRSPESEVFRIIRTGLLTECKKSDKRVIQVTSPFPGDGKSTTSVNVAVALAQTGKQVLIVDADLRKPKVADLLHVDNEVGLTDVLLQELDPMEVVVESAVGNLSVVGSGTIPANPAELLQSEEFGKILEYWRGEFDFVIVDSPPLLVVSDPSIVALETDGVLLALQVTKNGKRPVIRAKEILDSQGADLLGVVVNGRDSKQKAYGYSDGYDLESYGYGYGPTAGSYYGSSDQKVRKAKLPSVSRNGTAVEPASADAVNEPA